MKVFISILFSLFFVRAALSDDSMMISCADGFYLPAQQTNCEPCHERCPSGFYLKKTSTTCQQCDSETCPDDLGGTRGFYCFNKPSLPMPPTHKGIDECPSGFPDADVQQNGDAMCHVDFYFYPGKGAKFEGITATSDNDSVSARMNWKANSDFFTASADGTIHNLRSKFILGNLPGETSKIPTKTGYLFGGWRCLKRLGVDTFDTVTVYADTNIESGPANNRKLHAIWKYKVQYHAILSPSEELSSKGYDVESGEKFGLHYNMNLHAWDFGTNTESSKLFRKDGYVCKGWCVGGTNCSDSELLQPGDKICDIDNCGEDVKVTPNNGYVNLYAIFDTCDTDNKHRVANASTNKCICDRGYYGAATDIDEQTDCTKCPNEQTTDGPGKTNLGACKHMFKYKEADGSAATWGWSTNVVDTSGELSNIN